MAISIEKGMRLRDSAGHEYEVLDIDYGQPRLFVRRDGAVPVERWVMKSTADAMISEGRMEIVK